jgi:hypothetical protein
MDTLTQVQVIVYTVGGIFLVLSILGLKYLKPESSKKEQVNK